MRARAREHGHMTEIRGKIALVAASDKQRTAARRAQQLGCGGKKADDTHGAERVAHGVITRAARTERSRICRTHRSARMPRIAGSAIHAGFLA